MPGSEWSLELSPGQEEGHVDVIFDGGAGRAARNRWACDEARLVAAVDKSRPKASGLLAPMVRWVSPSGAFAVLERPPAWRTIHFCPTSRYNVTEEKTKAYTIPVPWTVYGVGMANHVPNMIMVYFAAHQIRSADDLLFVPPLPNVYEDGRFCLPAVSVVRPDLSGALQAAVEVVWSSGFNLDMDNALARYRHNQRPAAFYSGKAKPRGARGILQAWSRLDLVTVGAIPDWISPPTSNGSPTTVGSLIGLLEGYDQGHASPATLISTVRAAAAAVGRGLPLPPDPVPGQPFDVSQGVVPEALAAMPLAEVTPQAVAAAYGGGAAPAVTLDDIDAVLGLGPPTT